MVGQNKREKVAQSKKLRVLLMVKTDTTNSLKWKRGAQAVLPVSFIIYGNIQLLKWVKTDSLFQQSQAIHYD